MPDIFESVTSLWNSMRKGAMPTPQVPALARYSPPTSAGYQIRKDQMYFEVRVNELHLAENREWWSVFDPMVVIVAEYEYGGERVARPAVVGPSQIRTQAGQDKPRHGVVLQDCLVAGPNPYRGGNVEISMSFYRVRRSNSARSLLKVIDNLSGALPGAGEMATVAKVGSALLQGVEGLLGLDETVYLAGQRLSLTPSALDPLKACYSALVAPPVPADPNQFLVAERRLHLDDGKGARPYRGSDFALLGLSGSPERGAESSLPFYPMKMDALAALADGEDGKKRGKAALLTAYQQMRKSPDITVHQAGELFEAWINEFEEEMKRIDRVRSMASDITEPPPPPMSELSKDLNATVGRLRL
jgi:hypothetical protein